MKKLFMPGLLAAIGFLSCKHQVLSPGNPGGDNNDTSGKGGNSGICFEGQVLPVFLSSCGKAGCHDAETHEDGYVLDSYENIVREGIEPGRPENSKIYKAISEGEMPPDGYPKLSNEQVKLIRQWILEGAKNTVNCMDCDTAVYSYSAVVSKIMSANCTGCHSSALSSGGVDLSTYDGVLAVAMNGRLIGAITHDPAYAAMPQGGNKLSDCEIIQIEKWIASGASNN